MTYNTMAKDIRYKDIQCNSQRYKTNKSPKT